MKKLCSIILAAILLISVPFSASADFGGLLSNIQENFQPAGESITVEQLDAGQLLEEAANGKKLTIMIYMCGSDLESSPQCSATRDIQEMMASDYSTKDINLLIMPGGAKKWHISSINGEYTGIYSVRPEGITELWAREGRPNMGESETLLTLLDYSYKNFPAESYVLFFWDHGAGSIGGVCHDENENDMLSMLELKSAIEKSPFSKSKLELIGFDACLMASTEVSILMSPYAKYMVASEENEPGYGWDYLFLSKIDGHENGAEMGNCIVSSYLDFYSINYPRYDITMSCIDLSKAIELADGIDSFFSDAAKNILDEDTAEVSKAIRKVTSFGNSDANTRTGAYDLLDLGELIRSLDSYVPTDGTRLLDFLNNNVIVKTGHNLDASLSGLTLYHPLNDKRNYPAYMAVYKSFEILPSYSAYIENFGRMLTGLPSASYSGLLTSLGGQGKVQRLLISLPLSEEQAHALANAKLMVLQQNAGGDEAWHLVSVNDKVSLDAQSNLQGEFIFRNLFITDADGEIVSGTQPLYYLLNDEGQILIPVTLCGSDPESGETVENSAYLICEEDNNGFVSVVSMLAYDPVTEVYTARFQLDLSFVESIRFDCVDRTPTRGEDGALLGFDDWNIASVTEFFWPSDADYVLRFLENRLDENSLSVTFILTDIQSNQYSSELFGIAEEEEDIFYLIYDDKDQVIKLASPYCGLFDGLGMQLAFEVSNISDKEILVTLTGLAVEGNASDTEVTVYGVGEHDGLQPGESQTLFMIISQDQLDDLNTVENLEFSLLISNAETGEELALIPVRGNGHVTKE